MVILKKWNLLGNRCENCWEVRTSSCAAVSSVHMLACICEQLFKVTECGTVDLHALKAAGAYVEISYLLLLFFDFWKGRILILSIYWYFISNYDTNLLCVKYWQKYLNRSYIILGISWSGYSYWDNGSLYFIWAMLLNFSFFIFSRSKYPYPLRWLVLWR